MEVTTTIQDGPRDPSVTLGLGVVVSGGRKDREEIHLKGSRETDGSV